MRGHRLPDEVVERMGHLLAEGRSFVEVARELGVGRTSVMRYYPGRGWTPDQAAAAHPRKRVTPDLLNRAEAFLAEGVSIAECARTLGLPKATLWPYLKGRGWSAEEAGRWGMWWFHLRHEHRHLVTLAGQR